ncbi:hypothetical protein B5X24_HaOG216834 [Helicoverpa armigera]|nr:hypothetical protein B5X24_HaOG216834 [Helicoverpa armigera]
MFDDHDTHDIKVEQTQAAMEYDVSIKSEVKDEMSAEDIVCALNNDPSLSVIDAFPDSNDEHDDIDIHNVDVKADDDDEDYLDDIAIAALKPIKTKRITRREVTEQDTEKLNQVLRKSYSKVKDYVKFICPHCQKECPSWYRLKAHSESMHKVSPVVSCICGITLKSKSVMYKHVHDHRNPNVLSCDKCPRITKTLSALNKHKMRHIPKSERKFCCASCDKIFTSKDALKSHERSHIPIEERKIYRCDMCNMNNIFVQVHMYTHTGDKPLSCKWCDERFSYASTLRSHRLRCHPDKMAAQAHENYSSYAHAAMQEDYIKNDVGAVNLPVSVAKNEVEAM